MTALYLYSRVMPYTTFCLEALIRETGVEIHLVHYPVSENAPFQLPRIEGLTYHDQSKCDKESLESLVDQIKPRYVFVTGWFDKKYLHVAQYSKKRKIPVISGCDTQWRGDLRQVIAVLFSKWLIRKYFDFLMVAGSYQYEYARLLGFSRDKILKPLYVANSQLYAGNYERFITQKQKKYPKNVLFVGRFEKVKGIELLIRAFLELSNTGWTLTLVGSGSLKDEMKDKYGSNDSIFMKEFLQPEELVSEVANAGAFCLPSAYEPWGVVIQEFASAGLPMVTSDICGASELFVRDSYNGFIFKSGDLDSLKDSLFRLTAMEDSELLKYAERSHRVAGSVLPEMYVSCFSRFLNDQN